MKSFIKKLTAVFSVLILGGLATAMFTGSMPAFGYQDQQVQYVVGSSSALASTTSAIACTSGFNIRNVPQNNLAVKMQSVASGGSVFNMYFEYSPDNSNWYRDVTGNVGVSTTTLAANIHSYTTVSNSVEAINIPRQASMQRMRVCYQETGAATQGGVSVGLVSSNSQN